MGWTGELKPTVIILNTSVGPPPTPAGRSGGDQLKINSDYQALIKSRRLLQRAVNERVRAKTEEETLIKRGRTAASYIYLHLYHNYRV